MIKHGPCEKNPKLKNYTPQRQLAQPKKGTPPLQIQSTFILDREEKLGSCSSTLNSPFKAKAPY